MADSFRLPWTPYYTQAGISEASGNNDNEDFLLKYALAATLAFCGGVYVWESLLDARQARAYQSKVFPAALETTVRQMGNDSSEILSKLRAKFDSAQAYGRDKLALGRKASACEMVETSAFLLLGFLPYCWDTATWMATEWLGMQMTTGDSGTGTVPHEIARTLLFLALTTVAGTITGLPFEYYSTFHVEKKHGFNQQTLRLFITDKIKSLILTAAFGGPVVALLLTIIRSTGPYWYLYAWAFLFVFSVAMMSIVPLVIMPWFNQYTPLEDGALKTSIFALAKRLDYPLTKLFVMDGSKRSSHSNAFMFGFGRHKRIVLFDTLLTQVSDEEILAILGHELGHWKLGHTLTNFVVTQCYTGAAFWGFAQLMNGEDNASLFRAFGFAAGSGHEEIPVMIALLLFFQTLWAPVDKTLSFVLTLVSRHKEFAADRFGASLGYAQQLQTGLCRIHLENLGALGPDPWYSTYHYSHPPLTERLTALAQTQRKQQ